MADRDRVDVDTPVVATTWTRGSVSYDALSVVRYAMRGYLSGTGLVSWDVPSYPDWTGTRSPYAPASLSNITLIGSI